MEELQVSHPLEPYNPHPFTPEVYNPTDGVKRQHAFPRFGHPRDFGLLVKGVLSDGKNDQAKD